GRARCDQRADRARHDRVRRRSERSARRPPRDRPAAARRRAAAAHAPRGGAPRPALRSRGGGARAVRALRAHARPRDSRALAGPGRLITADVSSFFAAGGGGGIRAYYEAKARWLAELDVECHFVVPGRRSSVERWGGGWLHRIAGPPLASG